MKTLPQLCVCLGFGLMTGVAQAQALGQDPNTFSGFGLGITTGFSRGTHSVGIEVLGQSGSLASSELAGSSAGVSLDYLFKIDKWRVGPRWSSANTSFRATDRIGNPNVSLDTSLLLTEMHSLDLLLGRIVQGRTMIYGFGGVAFGHGTIAGQVNVLNYSASADTSGWVAGPVYGFGLKYQVEKNFELGVEVRETNFSKTFTRCEFGVCLSLPVKIKPTEFNFSLTRRW